MSRVNGFGLIDCKFGYLFIYLFILHRDKWQDRYVYVVKNV